MKPKLKSEIYEELARLEREKEKLLVQLGDTDNVEEMKRKYKEYYGPYGLGSGPEWQGGR